MFIEINPDNPDKRKITQVAEVLQKGGIVIYPTDTVYGLGCDIFNQKAVERVCQIRRLDPNKAMLSFICENISQLSTFTQPLENAIFKTIKRNTPGKFTFILNANNDVPKLFKNKKRTVGIRIPDNQIILDLVRALGRPILTTSLKSDDEIREYFTDPSEIYDDFEKLVDVVIDGGFCGNIPSTIVDCTKDEIEVTREGAGELV